MPLSAYHIRRWDSECLTLRGLLQQGALGRVLRFESRLERWRPQAKGGWKERGAPEEAGGLLYDIGSHLIDQALYLFGPVRDVYAELDIRRPGMEADDDVFRRPDASKWRAIASVDQLHGAHSRARACG